MESTNFRFGVHRPQRQVYLVGVKTLKIIIYIMCVDFEKYENAKYNSADKKCGSSVGWNPKFNMGKQKEFEFGPIWLNYKVIWTWRASLRILFDFFLSFFWNWIKRFRFCRTLVRIMFVLRLIWLFLLNFCNNFDRNWKFSVPVLDSDFFFFC